MSFKFLCPDTIIPKMFFTDWSNNKPIGIIEIKKLQALKLKNSMLAACL
jgi:hypothetical protein